MKRKLVVCGSIFSILIVLLASFPSVVSYQTGFSKATELHLRSISETFELLQNNRNELQRHGKTLVRSTLSLPISALKSFAATWVPGSLIVTYLLRLIVFIIVLYALYDFYCMAQDATPYSPEWFITMPFVLLVDVLIYLVLGIILLPWVLFGILYVALTKV
jgi:hypothetical protein